MADVHVTTWDELATAVYAAEDTDIYLDNDIDLNDEYPTGVPETLKRNGSQEIRIFGNNHSIKNIYHCRAAQYEANAYVFDGYARSYSTYPLFIQDVNFENVVIDYIASLSSSSVPCFANMVTFQHCTISITLQNNKIDSGDYQRNTMFGTDNTKLNQCAVTVRGIGNSTTYPSFVLGGQSWFNNINITGDFSRVDLSNLYYSYVRGDFKQKNTYSNASVFRIAGVANVINATMNMAKMIDSTGSSMTVINTDNLTYPSGQSATDLPATLIQATTSDMHSVSALQQLGFPIR